MGHLGRLGGFLMESVHFLKDVSATTKGIKEKAMLAFQLILLVQIRIYNG